MKTRRELEDELARIQAELKALDDCEFKYGDKIWWINRRFQIAEANWHGHETDLGLLKRGCISKERKTLEDKDRREIIETQLLKYEVKGGDAYLALGVNRILYIAIAHGAYVGEIRMSLKSAERCLDEMNHDDLIWYLTRGAV